MTKIHKAIQEASLKVNLRKRTIYSYQANTSIARMREDGHSCCGSVSLQQLFKNKHVCDLISDHAARRIQLFYYTAVVYHKEKCLVSLDKTISQIGKSECKECSAAHSAIHPRLWDNSNSVLRREFRKKPKNTRLLSKLCVLGFKKHELETCSSKKQITRLFEEYSKTQGDRLIKSTSAMQSALDSTVVVPREVNEYDCVLENHVRPIALGFLQSVSYGAINPYLATEMFVRVLTDFFGQSAQATAQVKVLVKKMDKVTSDENFEELRKEIKKVKLVRPVLNRDNSVELLDADLKIIKLQRAATVLPQKSHLTLGLSLFQQKLLLLKA